MNVYTMAQLGSNLGLPERFFVTRDKGEQAYALIKTELEAVPEGEPLVLAFPPQQLMDASFADESIVRLGEAISNGEFGQRTLLLRDLTDDTIHNLNAVIQLRHLKLAFLGVGAAKDEDWSVIGQLEPSLYETLEIVARRRRLTAPELSEMLGMAINTASNRLKRLNDVRLIRREYEVSERGLQYLYDFWEW
jgi:DNA-binding MarR family transcriptional regulator